MKQKTAQNTSRRPIQEPLWIPSFAEMTKKYQSPLSHGFPLFPRRRESIGHHSDPHWGSFLESTESSMSGPIFQAHLNSSVMEDAATPFSGMM